MIVSGRHTPSDHPHHDNALELVRRPLRERLARPGGRHRAGQTPDPAHRDWTGEAQNEQDERERAERGERS